MSNYLCNACICYYNSIDTKDIKIGIVNKTDCLCLVNDCCLAVDTESLGVGMVTAPDEICKVGLAVCTLGLKKPTTCIAAAQHCLCIKEAVSFPFDKDYVPSFTCAYCFLSCAPEFGCAVQAPAMNNMSR